jgi:hypothetical protein
MRRGFVRSVLLAVVLACGWQATVAAPALAERGRSAPRPNPTKLWKAYPLIPREQSFPGTKPAAVARTRIPAPGSSDGRQFSPPLLVSFALALAILAGGLLLDVLRLQSSRRQRLHSRHHGVPRPNLGIDGRDLLIAGARGADVAAHRTHAGAHAASARPRKDISTAHSMRGQERNETVNQAKNPTSQSGSDTDKVPVDGERTEVGRAEQVGEQVAAVLVSAEQAAEQIRESARQDAERIRAEAKDEVATALSATKLEAERGRRESEKLRADADAYKKQTREAADRYVTETHEKVDKEVARWRAEVDEQVRGIRRAAELKAKDLETEARARQKTLLEQVARAEARLEQLLGIFRGMTLQLEGLVSADSARRSGDQEEKTSVAEPLDEALKPRPSARRSTY